MKYSFLCAAAVFLLALAVPAVAQSPVVSPLATEASDVFVAEGLTDDDLEADLEAEVLPSDGFAYRWERIKFGLRRAFTFNAEKKAALDREFLHRLDRKLTACSELGDTQCVERVEEAIANAKARHEAFLEKRVELKEKHLEQFEAWRQQREARVLELKQRAVEQQGKREELKQEWESRREAVKERREVHREQIKENIQERREHIQAKPSILPQRILEQKQQNQEQLIELRSQNVKNQLDTTRAKVLEHERQLKEQQRQLQPQRVLPEARQPITQ